MTGHGTQQPPSDVPSSQPNASGLAFETGPRPLVILDNEENGGFECERGLMFECGCGCGNSLTFDLNNKLGSSFSLICGIWY